MEQAKVSEFTVDGYRVYIHWLPTKSAKVKHEILRGKGGGIDVMCYHEELDKKLIKKQVKYVLRRDKKVNG